MLLVPKEAPGHSFGTTNTLSWRPLMAEPTAVAINLPRRILPADQCGGDWGFWVELLATMLNGGKVSAFAKVEGARAAILGRDRATLRQLAHALKGSCAALCLSQLTLVRGRGGGGVPPGRWVATWLLP